MSSPFSVRTKRGTEESIEALERAATWLRRVDNNDVSGSLDKSISELIADLDDASADLTKEHRKHIVEREVENFVVNRQDEVLTIITGTLDERVSGLETVSEYISDEFGYIDMPQLSKDELLWLVAHEVIEQKNSQYGPEDYDDLYASELETLGTSPPEA